jgi:riboflavin synthase
MFTGIVEAVADVLTVERNPAACRLTIRSLRVTPDLAVGSSIAIDGVCLTVEEVNGDRFRVDVGPETLRRTTLGKLTTGDRVNVERPLRLDTRLGGHLVQGHVDGVGTIARIIPEGETRWVEITLPDDLRGYIVEKGSVAVDGISLTVAGVTAEGVAVSLIPHTLVVTTLGTKHVGNSVNIEVDILAKYVERLMAAHLEAVKGRADARTV